MEKTLISKEDYLHHFGPQDYAKTYYSLNSDSGSENTILTFSLKNLHKAFILVASRLQVQQHLRDATELLRSDQIGLYHAGSHLPSLLGIFSSGEADGIKGDTLIDIGSGPTIYQFLSACESFREIIATDFTNQNREEMQRWLRKELGAFDWSSIAKFVCELEGDREKWVEKEEKVRRTIKQVLKCDVTQASPLAPLVVPPADCVLSLLCLESASKDLPTYSSVVKNAGSLVKSGGHLILVTCLESTFYMAGQNRFFCLYLEQENVDNAVKAAGFDIVWAKLERVVYSVDVCNNRGMYALVAQKQQ